MTFRTTLSTDDNHLLAMLPAESSASLKDSLELVDMPLGHSVHEPGVEMKYVYFPVDCIVSLLCLTENGGSVAIAVVGSEGIVGVPVFMGGETTTSHAVVQSGGHAYRLPGDVLKTEFIGGGAMQRPFLRFLEALLTQIAQTTVCIHHHTVDQHLCRLLLLSHDRLRSSELIMTQELIAKMLGVRCEGASEVVGKLQKAGLIQYHRGHITICDRAGLKARACEHHGVIKGEYDRLLAVQTAD